MLWEINLWLKFSSAQSCPTPCDPWTAACQASLSITNSQNLLKLMSIASMMPSNHLILCRPFLLLPAIFPSIRVFSTELALHIRWPKDWSFDFSMSWTTWNRKFSTGKKQNSSPWEMSPRQCCAEKNLAGALFFPMVTPFTLELCPFSKEDSLWLLKILKGDCFSRHLWLLCKYSFFRNRCTDRKNW